MSLSHHSHWGSFRVERLGADLLVQPHPHDPDPSPLLANIPSAPPTTAPAAQPTAAPAAGTQPTQASAAAVTTSGEPVYFGVSAPLSGQLAKYGAFFKRGFGLALEEINGSGGTNGRPVALDWQDTQSHPKQSVAVAQKFVYAAKKGGPTISSVKEWWRTNVTMGCTTSIRTTMRCISPIQLSGRMRHLVASSGHLPVSPIRIRRDGSTIRAEGASWTQATRECKFVARAEIPHLQ